MISPHSTEQIILAPFFAFLQQETTEQEIEFAKQNTKHLMQIVKFAYEAFQGSMEYVPSDSIGCFVSAIGKTFNTKTAISIISHAAFYKLAADFYIEVLKSGK